MSEMISFENKERITSLELVGRINEYRTLEGNNKTLLHKSLLKKIELRIAVQEACGNGQNILPVDYADKKGEKRKAFSLDYDSAMSIIAQESVFVSVMYEQEIRTLRYTVVSQQEVIVNQTIRALEYAVETKAIEIKGLVNTKGEINSRKTATAMNTASQLRKSNKIAWEAVKKLSQTELEFGDE